MKFHERFRGFLPVVLDLETGGTNPSRHALLELSVILLQWDKDQLLPKSTQTWEIEPHPDMEVTDESKEVTGINPDDPKRTAQPEGEVIREAFRLIRKEVRDAECNRAVLTAHNAHFDHSFIKAAATRNKIGRNPFHPFTVLDTASMCAVAVGHTVLHEAAKRLEIDYDEKSAHSATYDAQVAAQVFCEIVNRSGFTGYS